MNSNLSRNALGSRLKELRSNHDLTIAALARELDISRAYVGFLEKGTRNASRNMLAKYADFFEVSVDDLLNLQSQADHTSKVDATQKAKKPPNNIEELTKLLKKLDGDLQTSLLEDFKNQTQKVLDSLLTTFEVSDIEQKLMSLKAMWFSNRKNFEALTNHEGYINLSTEKLYFQLHLEQDVLHLQVLNEDRKLVSLFEDWLSEPMVTYTSDVNLKHIAEPKKVLNSLWFSPNMSYREQYDYLIKENLLSTELHYSETKFEWFINNYHKQSTSKETNEQAS